MAAAGAAVTVATEGEPWVLPGEADHSAYRILQESLTNVLRHAGPGAAAEICLCYQPEALTITVTDHGSAAAPDGAPLSADRGAVPEAADVPERTSVPEATDVPEGTGSGGHGIRGMRERAVSAGGHLTAGPLPGGGFRVTATLPAPAYSAGDTAAARGASS